MMVSAQLVIEAPSIESRVFYAMAARDEAIHSLALARYATIVGGEVEPPNPEHLASIAPLTSSDRNVLDRMILHTLLEGFALVQFKILIDQVEDELLGSIYRYIRGDEARHVGIGMYLCEKVMKSTNQHVDVGALGEVAQALARVCVKYYALISRQFGLDIDEIERLYETPHTARLRRLSEALPLTNER